MPTITTRTVLATGGDYTTLALWEADTDNDLVTADVQEVALLGRNTVESVTLASATTDATRNRVIRSYFGSNIGRRSLYARADCIYGSLTTSDEFVDIEDVAIARGGAGGIAHGGVAANTVNARRVWVQGATSSGNAFRMQNTHASSVFNTESCVAVNCIGNGFRTVTGVTGTANFINSLAEGCAAGFGNFAGTVNCKNTYGVNTDDYSASIGHTTTAQADGGVEATSQVTETAWARANARSAAMLSYWTGENEPTYAPGKIDRAVLYRRRGDNLGSLGGDAAIASGLLTGTTGGLSFAEGATTSVNTRSGAVKGTMPATPASRGLMQLKASGDDNNRIDFGIDSSGRLYVTVYTNAGAADHTLLYTPDADQLAGTHTYGWRVHSGNTYLYLDGVEVATVADAVTRDATDTLATLVGGDGTNNIEASASISHAYTGTGAAAPPTLPLAQNDWQDRFELTSASSATLQKGGTDAGAPDLDAAGQSFQNPPSIGAHQYIQTASGDPRSVGSHGLFGHHAMLASQPGNSGFNSYFG